MNRESLFQKPTDSHLRRLYYELGKIGARSVGRKEKWPYRIEQPETLLALAADWTRHDPRLLEVMLQFALSGWQAWKPQEIREASKKMETPQTWGVIAGFVQAAKPEDMELGYFWEYVVRGLKPVADQYYFFDLYTIGGEFSRQATRESLQQFRDWGFFGKERIIIHPQTKEEVGHWGQNERLNILRRLFRKTPSLKVADYLREICHTVSRQQAIQDLRKVGGHATGSGRGSVWVL